MLRAIASKAAVAIMRSRLPLPVGPTVRAIRTLVAIPSGRRKMFTPNAWRVFGRPKVQLARFLSVVDINSHSSNPLASSYRQYVITILNPTITVFTKKFAGFIKLVVGEQMMFEQDHRRFVTLEVELREYLVIKTLRVDVKKVNSIYAVSIQHVL